MQPVRILLVGLGGYGSHYVNAALDHSDDLGLQLAGIVDPFANRAARYDEIRQKCGGPHESITDFFSADTADLVVVSAPIQFHAPFSVEAMEAGAAVLCEKPAAGSIQGAVRMREIAEQTGSTLLIGYQWSFADAVNQLRERVGAGEFGVCRHVRVLGLWPRGAAYFNRNDWAGKLADNNGAWILDSPLNNALAHYVHNPLYVLGQGPETVQAELYRANPIETFDTVALRANLSAGTELLFCVSHAVSATLNPVIQYTFDNHAIIGRLPGIFSIRHPDGSVETLESADVDVSAKLGRAAAIVRGEQPAVSTIADSLDQLRVVAGAHLSSVPREFPQDRLRTAGDITWVDGLAETLALSFGSGMLPGEIGSAEWAQTAEIVTVAGVERFDGPRAATAAGS